jgi:hypothetical protein
LGIVEEAKKVPSVGIGESAIGQVASLANRVGAHCDPNLSLQEHKN